MKKIIFLLSFFLILYFPVITYAANENLFFDEIKDFPDVSGYNVSDVTEDILDGRNTFSFSFIVDKLKTLLFGEMKENISVIVQMTAVGILSGILSGFCSNKNEIGTLACVSIMALLGLKTFRFAVSTAEETVDTLLMFVQTLMPTIAGITVATGGAAQTAACGSVFVAMQVFIHICRVVLIPMISVLTVFAVVNCMGDARYLKGLTELIQSVFKWGVGLLLTLYGIVVGIESQSAITFDSVAGKTVKYAIGSFVPVVGGAISDSLEVIGMSARSTRSALGISGIIGIIYLCLNPLIQVSIVAFSYKVASCLCAPAANKKVTKVLQEVGGSLMRICGIILCVGVMFTISLGMLCRMGGNAI